MNFPFMKLYKLMVGKAMRNLGARQQLEGHGPGTAGVAMPSLAFARMARAAARGASLMPGCVPMAKDTIFQWRSFL